MKLLGAWLRFWDRVALPGSESGKRAQTEGEDTPSELVGAPHVDTLEHVPRGEAEETLPVSAGVAADSLCSQEHHFLKHGTVVREKS